MFKVHYHWRRIYLYPGLNILLPFLIFVYSIYAVLFQPGIRLVWEGASVIAFTFLFLVWIVLRRYEVFKRSRQVIRVRDEFLTFMNVDITIHYSQIKHLKLYDNGLSEIYTKHENYKIVVLSMDMVNYDKLMDWLVSKEVIMVNDKPKSKA